MDLEMIINCRVTCTWMRARDHALHILSVLLWVALLLALYHMKGQELLSFISSFYLTMLFVVSGLLLLWSHYCKLVTGLPSNNVSRRTRCTSLAPKTTAEYFLMEETQVRALQCVKSTVVQHGPDGHPSSLLFHNHSLLQSVSFKNKMAQYDAAA